MSDVPRLLAAFESGRLLRPAADEPNLVDLVQAVAQVTGAAADGGTPAARDLAQRIVGPPHVVFVLADGLGASMLERAPPDSWLRRHLEGTLLTTFPSTTAAALTTVATGLWPAEHATVGWWTYLPALGEAAIILPYQRLADEHPLEDLDIDPADAFPATPLASRMRAASASVMPAPIADSTYSRYMSGGGPRLPYESYAEAVEHIAARIERASGPTYTYWYTSRIDAEAHDSGATATSTLLEMLQLDAALEALCNRLGPDARVVVTSDHGHLDIPRGGRRTIEPGDPLLSHLACPPSGDVRVLYFHLPPGADDAAREAFASVFRARYGAAWVLVTTDELDELRLLGPGPLAEETRRRVGDFTAIGLGADVMRYQGVRDPGRFLRQRGQHSGLSPDEMRIPLVVA